MSENTEVQSESPAPEAEAAAEPASETPKTSEATNFASSHRGMLTQVSDHAARPGFRSPSNKRSKASKKGKKKRRR